MAGITKNDERFRQGDTFRIWHGKDGWKETRIVAIRKNYFELSSEDGIVMKFYFTKLPEKD